MDSKGEFVLVANQDSDEIVFFTRDSVTGFLKDTGTRLQVPSPVCLKMGI
jgi:6-phosphogluconolactonase